MEKGLGRSLKSNEIVHHLNHIKTDNRPENLVILTRGEHPKIHNQSTGRWSKLFDKCIKCGTIKIHHEIHGLCYECWKISRRKS